jgi:hypothetical protein
VGVCRRCFRAFFGCMAELLAVCHGDVSVPCVKPDGAALPTVLLVTLRWCAVHNLTGWLMLEVP